MDKSPEAFRTISEAADDLDLPQHVLRFWETRFSQIKPMKRGGGRRYYRPDDIDLLKGIRFLLYDEGYTIKGVQRILKTQGNKYVIGIGSGEIVFSETPAAVPTVETEIEVEPTPQFAAKAGKTAVSVKDLSNQKSSPSKGLLDRFRAKDTNEASSETSLDVSDEDRRNLQSTLYELLECKRLLDQVRSD